MFKYVLFISFTLSSLLSNAFIIAQKTSSALTTWQSERKTHVIVASKGTMFAAVGYHQANLFTMMYPDDQILFISNLPTSASHQTSKQKQLKMQSFKIIEESAGALTSEALIKTLLKLTSNIKTLTIISHNGVDLGPWLEDGDRRLAYKDAVLMSQLKNSFNPEAWVRIQGCNSGWNVAPALSRHWNVPVIGSFTSSSFYYFSKNGIFEIYRSIEEQKVGREFTPAAVFNGFACPGGTCFTLIPEAGPYHFRKHRSPEAAWLPTVKPVCNASISDQRCEKAFAESLVLSAHSYAPKQALNDISIFKKVIFQSICGSYATKDLQLKCIASMAQSYEQRSVYFPYRSGTALKCQSLRACSFTQLSIDLRKNKSGTENTLLELIDSALSGFRSLQ